MTPSGLNEVGATSWIEVRAMVARGGVMRTSVSWLFPW